MRLKNNRISESLVVSHCFVDSFIDDANYRSLFLLVENFPGFRCVILPANCVYIVCDNSVLSKDNFCLTWPCLPLEVSAYFTLLVQKQRKNKLELSRITI